MKWVNLLLVCVDHVANIAMQCHHREKKRKKQKKQKEDVDKVWKLNKLLNQKKTKDEHKDEEQQNKDEDMSDSSSLDDYYWMLKCVYMKCIMIEKHTPFCVSEVCWF